jgi:hypothetical protein
MARYRGALAVQYLAGLPRYLRDTLSAEDCRRLVSTHLEGRRNAFLGILERGVYAQPASPYRRLLLGAGIDWEQASAWVLADGVEAALARFHNEGVYIALEEFKGSKPIRRLGLEMVVAAEAFDNPLLDSGYVSQTGGSRSRGVPVLIDHGLLEHEAAYDRLSLEALGLLDRRKAVWRPVPPGVAGIKDVLRQARHGHPVERWFSPTRLGLSRPNWRHALFTYAVLAAARLVGKPLATPEHIQLGDPLPIVRWLAGVRAQGEPGLLDTSASSAVRVCLAAQEAGLDISGSVFRVGGEPYTPARDRVIRSAGCRGFSRYSMAESGNLGLPCARPQAIDEVHLVTDKVAVLQRDREVGEGGTRVGALFLTTLLPHCPKLMINVESDDYGTLLERDCGCLLGEVGFSLHLHGIRSYGKLTAGGMHFLGGEIIWILEELLPLRFGGGPTDYQLVEEEREDGLSQVNLLVHPRLGEIDESRIVATVLAALGNRGDAPRMMARYWRDGETLQVLRREPHSTAAAKVLPLHLVRRDSRRP